VGNIVLKLESKTGYWWKSVELDY